MHERVTFLALILEKNLDKVDWVSLSGNPDLIHILEKNLDKVDLMKLSMNPSIFQIEYDTMRETKKDISEEIAKIVWHPRRMYKWHEDHLIYDCNDYLNISITSTIRNIKNSIKLRS